MKSVESGGAEVDRGQFETWFPAVFAAGARQPVKKCGVFVVALALLTTQQTAKHDGGQ